MKKILFYFNSLVPSGGIERVIVTLANSLCNNYKVTILVKDQPVSFYRLDQRVEFIGLNSDFKFNMDSRLSRFYTASKAVLWNVGLLRAHLSANAYEYHYLAHPLNVLEFHIARGVNDVDTIITEHGSPDAYNYIYKFLKKILYFRCKAYVVPTMTDSEHYKKLNYPVLYIPHFKSDICYRKAELKNKVALSIGRFTEVKQQMILLKIWNSLVHHHKITDWKLILVGSGELKADFEQYIFRNDLTNHVLLGQPSHNVAEYYIQSSIFLLSSRTEGFGMVLLEAVSFGIPCVAFDCPSGPRDIIRNNVNGYLIKPNDVGLFKTSVINLINDPKTRNNMGSRSFEISKEWDHDKLLSRWCSILN